MGRISEGLWDCTYCRAKGIGGSKRECPNCGHVRDEDTKFYPANEPKYLSDEEAQKISRKPDWLCLYCGGSLNPDDKEYCVSCGAKRTSENLDYFQNRKKQREKAEANMPTDYSEEAEGDLNSENTTQNAFTKFENIIVKNKVKVINVVAVFTALAVILGIVYLLIPKERQITITQTSWERSIQIEEYKTVKEDDWRLPDKARLLYQKEEIYEYNNILDHYETKTKTVTKQRIVGYEDCVVGQQDLGNGYFEEIVVQNPIYETYSEEETYQEPVYISVPVYKTKYYYEIDKWMYERSIITKGNDKTPYWGEVVLKEKERQGKHLEKYLIEGKDSKGKSYSISLSYEQWQKVNVNDSVKVKIYVTGEGKIIN